MRMWQEALHGGGGLAERRRLVAAGLTTAELRRLVRSGDLIEVRAGSTRILATPSALCAPGARQRVALVGGGPLAFLRRLSAGASWALDRCPEPAEPDIGVARHRHNRRGRVSRVAGLRPGDVVVRDGLRMTSAQRTLVDLGAVLRPDDLECAVESAIRLGYATDADLRDPALVAGRWRGHVLASVLRDRPPGAPATGSVAETIFVQLLRARGVPAPERQWRQVLGRRYSLDFAWPALRVAVEIDGAATHGPGELAGDLRRQNCVVLGGWLLLRFTWDDVVHHPDSVVAEVRAALEQGRIGVHA